MKSKDFDIVISGGGVAGLTAAAAFGNAGFRVLCIDPASPVTDGAAVGADLRTTAFLLPARRFLEEAGIWQHLAPHGARLDTMRIIDAGGAAPVQRDFEASDLSDETDAAPFGWNLPNWLIRRALLDRLADLSNVTFRPGVATSSVQTRTSEAFVTLSDGARIRTRIVIAADGRNSPVREAAGIGVRRIDFKQDALTFAVTHEAPHGNVSTEVHRTGGPCTLVPLPDHEGRPCSAVVWMERPAEAQRLLEMDVPAFEAEATKRTTGILGPLTLVSRRTCWPIISMLADRLYARRIAIVAEAAHVVPPIGAQGLNMSLADLQTLLDLARAGPEALGSEEMLATYHRARFNDIRTRVMGVSALNRTSMATPGVIRKARSVGLGLLHDVAPVRKTLMRLGMGMKRF